MMVPPFEMVRPGPPVLTGSCHAPAIYQVIIAIGGNAREDHRFRTKTTANEGGLINMKLSGRVLTPPLRLTTENYLL
jgi:hypothetical protein